jgi:hypothetical protein
MKLTSLLLFLPIFTLGQMKFDNTITINEFISYSTLKATLFDYGMIINGSDTSIFETNEIKQKKDEVYIKLRLKRTDSSLVIKGLMKINITIVMLGVSSTPEFQPIEFWKDKKSRPRLAFDLVDEFAKHLSQKITYSKS